MTSQSLNAGYNQYNNISDVEMQNSAMDMQRDTEPIFQISGSRTRSSWYHFDWYIWSCLGCLCCPLCGICAMYYAMRSNSGYDHNIQEDKLQSSTTKAKILTILSIVLGILFYTIGVIYIANAVNRIESFVHLFHNHDDDDDTGSKIPFFG